MLRRILPRLLWFPIVLLGIAATPFGAYAQPQCDLRENVIDVLRQKYKEQPVAMGVTNNGGLVEVLATGNGTTWSIIVTTPQGMSCLVAAGENWRAMKQVRELDPET